MTTETTLGALNDDQVFEVARAVLPDLVDVSDPDEAGERALQALGRDADGEADLRREVDSAATHDTHEVADLLRTALSAAARQSEATARDIAAAAEDSGRRETVAGLDLIALGVFLLVAYIAVGPSRKQSEKKVLKVEETEDGRIAVHVEEQTTYYNPATSIGKLLRQVLLASQSDDAGPPSAPEA